MEENKLKVEQEVIKNTTVTEVVFWISTLYNLVSLPVVFFSILIFPFDSMFDAFWFTFFIAVTLSIAVLVSTISFSRLIDLRKISWQSHKNIFVIFFIGTTFAVFSVLMFSFIAV